MEKTEQAWLTLWGIFIALFIQVVYESVDNSFLKLLLGISIASLGLAILAVFSVCYFGKKKNSILPIQQPPTAPNDNEKREWKLSVKILKDGHRELEVIGMNADSVDKIFKSWKENVDK